MTEEDKIKEDGQIGVIDDLGVDSLKELQTTIERELEMYNEEIESLAREKKNYKDQWDIEDEMYQIRLSGNVKIQPDFVYEDNPRYWELVTKMVEYKYRQEKHLAEERIADFDRRADIMRERIADREEQLQELLLTLNGEDEE
jgi:tryptophan 2,3-dioxygenase